MTAWTQIIVKGTIRDIRAQLDARHIPAYRCFHNPGGQRPYRDTAALVPGEPEILAKLDAWFAETKVTDCQPGTGFPPGTLLWFGPYIGKVPLSSLHRVSEYETLESYLKEM